MGKNTYEFGYKFGLQPEQTHYPHMFNYIFSNNLKFENASPNVLIKRINLEEIEKIQNQSSPDILFMWWWTVCGMVA